MSNLTGQQIQNTYDGLLNLEDSTNGITSNLQAIQDGLGNDTGLRIKTNQLESDNIPSLVSLKGRHYGTGFQNANVNQYGAGTQNIMLASGFYDNGNYSYSSITFNTTTITSTSDTVQAAIYTSQLINPFGLYPASPIISGITANTTTLGLNTFVFPSNISMSGYGAGIYWIVFKISNGGVTPTWRPGQQSATIPILLTNAIYGVTQQVSTNTFTTSIRANNTAATLQVFTGSTTFDNPYSTNLPSLQSTLGNFSGLPPGFLLNTVDA
jgi:hypothetical protein